MDEKDFIIGGPNELDLSVLGKSKIGNSELPVADAKKIIKFDGLSDSAIMELLKHADKLKELEQYGGLHNWFVPGTKYGIDKLPKHKAFFDASAKYTEIYFSAGNRCIAEGTLVATPVGPVAIEDIRVGDFVYDRDGKPTRVVNRFDNGVKEVFPLKNRGKIYGWVTSDHELDTYRQSHERLIVERRVRADSLVRDMKVRRRMTHSPLGSVSFPLAYALGALLGDGCSREISRRSISISSGDDGIPAKIANILGTSFKKNHKNNYTYQINCLPENLPHYMEFCHGKYAHEKIVDMAVLRTWNRETVLNFVAGLIDTDGSLGVGRDGHCLSLSMQAKSVIDAYCYCVLALWNEEPSITVDAREKYKNGPVYCANVRSPHKLRAILDELRPYLVNKRKATIEEDIFGGQRSCLNGIHLKLGTESRLSRVYDLTVEHEDHFYLLANGISVSNCGKTQAAAFATACHLTGIYPDWWEGKRFRRPPHGWALAITNAQTRDVIQTKLLGPIGSYGTGMIPKELIAGTTTKSGAGGAIDILRVQHSSGGIATLAFKSAEQGREALQGVTLDFAWADELPPQDVYSEVFMRLMTTKGFIMVTATPLEGMTPLVFSFYSQADFLPPTEELPSVLKLAREDHQRQVEAAQRKGEDIDGVVGGKNKAVIVAGWDDAPWLGEDEKITMLAARPEHLRQASKTGIPGSAGGNIYPIPLEEILIDDFPIPPHFKLITGFDVGWNNTAAAFVALDPDTDIAYLYADYKRGKAEPVIHAQALKTISKWADAPVAIDPAAEGRSQVDGKQLLNMYRQLGIRVHKADNGVEAGIYTVWERLSTGKLRVFKSCKEFQREYITYARDEKGRVKKENDHVLDSVRYSVVMLHLARASYRESSAYKVKGNTSGKRYFR